MKNKILNINDTSSILTYTGTIHTIDCKSDYYNNYSIILTNDTIITNGSYRIDNINIDTNSMYINSSTGSVNCNIYIGQLSNNDTIIYNYGLSIITFIFVVVMVLLPYYLAYKLAIHNWLLSNKKSKNEK